MKTWELIFKRSMDVIGSGAALTLFCPLMLFAALLVRLSSPGPILFRRQRLGKDGIPFTIYKFRTMYVNAPDWHNPDGSAFNADDDPRVTPCGRFLRRISLDELPQLFCVLKGEMSLVGPRPDELRALALYSERHRTRLRVKPGITSLAVVNGRNSIPWHERLELDIKYVENYALIQDFGILLRTFKLVLTCQGINTNAVGKR
jgi:lipopolysaccharide/colanic/teichoic acid biosynthesis glycosyltransferase